MWDSCWTIRSRSQTLLWILPFSIVLNFIPPRSPLSSQMPLIWRVKSGRPDPSLSHTLTLIVPRAWDIGFMQPCINFQGKSATHFVYFWSRKTLPYTHLEAISYIPQQGQSLHIWITSLSAIGCNKNKYTIQFLLLVCISRFAVAITSSETELALGTIRVNFIFHKIYVKMKKKSSLFTEIINKKCVKSHQNFLE